MSDRKHYPNYSAPVSGFYYDQQTSDGLMSVTLHANTKYFTDKDGKNGKWDKWDGSTDSDGYGTAAIARAIVNEDFSVGISNNWGGFDGGNPIENVWSGVAQPMAGFLDFGNKAIDTISQKSAEFGNEDVDSFTGKFASVLSGYADDIKSFNDKASGYLRKQLIVQGSRFVYYSGTSTSFSNLGMKFVVFADYIPDQWQYRDTRFPETGVVGDSLLTVGEKLKDLYPYLMGTYEDFTSDPNSGEYLNQFLGWQDAPGGFKTSLKNIDIQNVGTLKLKFGSYYSIDNLIVQNAQITMSRQMVKHPKYPGMVSPLFGEVSLLLQPASRYTDRSLKKFINGDGMWDERKSLKDEIIIGLDSRKIINPLGEE